MYEHEKDRFSIIFKSLGGQQRPFDFLSQDSGNPLGETPKIDYSSLLGNFDRGLSTGEPSLRKGTSRIVTLNIDAQPGYDRLSVPQVFGAKMAMASLRMAVSFGYVDEARIRRIMDFGAGSGGPTFALVAAAREIGASVDAVELGKTANAIVESGILPRENVLQEDGIAYLNSLAERGVSQYDLVTAFMLGPDEHGVLFRQLAQACRKALTPYGNLLVISDLGTFSAAQEACEQAGLPFNRIRGVSDNGEIVVPNVLIVPQASSAKVTAGRVEINPFKIGFDKGDLFSKKFRLFDPEDKTSR